jgi:AAA domain, putative AbiEii toxin, Type IV TA system
LFIPSHRPTFAYQQVSQIPTTPPTREQMLNQYLGEFRSRYYGGGNVSSSYRLKEALIALAVFGEGNTVVQPNPEALDIYQGFVRTLREVLPPALGFRDLSIRMPEIVMLTDSGDFSFDAVSGGVAAIIDLAFQIYMRSYQDDHFVVIIDEPENHLHPELQRSLLPGFLDAFPGIQFIVATHNPFMVGPVPDSNVYVLRHDSVEMSDALIQEGIPRRRVVSTLLENVDKAGTSDDILRDVLGVPATKALWVERSIQQILARYEQEPLTEDLLRSLHREFERLGLADVFPQNAKRIIDRDKAN